MSNLVEHARRELEIIGEEKETVDGILRVIRAFADMEHSGGSASVCIPWIYKLLQFQNLSPLTNNPDEWMDVSGFSGGEVMFQNKRNPSCFSDDGGITYWSLDDGATATRRHPRYTANKE